MMVKNERSQGKALVLLVGMRSCCSAVPFTSLEPKSHPTPMYLAHLRAAIPMVTPVQALLQPGSPQCQGKGQWPDSLSPIRQAKPGEASQVWDPETLIPPFR